jgi:hypothetical protein
MRCLLAASCLLASSGCGGAEPDSEARTDTRSALDCNGRGVDIDGFELSGDHGVDLAFQSAEPMPPVTGDNTWVVELTDADGEPVVDAGEDIAITPHMPDHGHGTPVAVQVAEQDDGVYRLAPVNTFMPGYWQITLELTTDELSDVLVFGVCVE